MEQPCAKVRFSSWEEAQTRLHAIADKPVYGPRPRHAYYCGACKGYHLTKTAGNRAQREAEKIVFARQSRIKLAADYWIDRLFRNRRK